MRFGLKAALLLQGKSQRELGKATDISENKLSEIVRGWTDTTTSERARIATALHKSEDELFDINSTHPNPERAVVKPRRDVPPETRALLVRQRWPWRCRGSRSIN
jgi:transcriptional regulator with XRE-family HTH domain